MSNTLETGVKTSEAITRRKQLMTLRRKRTMTFTLNQPATRRPVQISTHTDW